MIYVRYLAFLFGKLIIFKCLNSVLTLSLSPFQDFQFGGGGGPSSGGISGGGKVPPLIREFLNSLDDKEWQNELYKLLQNQSFNQVEVDLFELLCKVLDHNLFAQVDWARNSYYFKELKVGIKTKRLKDGGGRGETRCLMKETFL